MDVGLTPPLTERSTRNISLGGCKGSRCVGLTLPLSGIDCTKLLGASTSYNPQDLSRLVMGYLYLYLNMFPSYFDHLQARWTRDKKNCN